MQGYSIEDSEGGEMETKNKDMWGVSEKTILGEGSAEKLKICEGIENFFAIHPTLRISIGIALLSLGLNGKKN